MFDRRGQWSNRPPLHLLTAPTPIEPVVEVYIPPEQRKGILDLGPNDCRWPIGDPKDKEFHFCGHARGPVGSYCEQHAKRAYAAPVSQVAPHSWTTIPTHGPDDLPEDAIKAA